ncbi:MAG: hypothetical protein AB7D51_13460 [Desulfovibrionaceae bacterium]
MNENGPEGDRDGPVESRRNETVKDTHGCLGGKIDVGNAFQEKSNPSVRIGFHCIHGTDVWMVRKAGVMKGAGEFFCHHASIRESGGN